MSNIVLTAVASHYAQERMKDVKEWTPKEIELRIMMAFMAGYNLVAPEYKAKTSECYYCGGSGYIESPDPLIGKVPCDRCVKEEYEKR